MINKKPKKITLPRAVKRLFPQVESAVDADKPVEVSVSAKDCKEGKKLNPAECALAQATRRELKADGVIIGISSSYVIKGKQAIRFDTPESVRREIVSFDRHQDFAPGDYYLQPKSPTSRLGAGKEYQRDYRKKHGGKITRRKIHTSARIRILDKGRE